MKKVLISALFAVAMLASCSNEESFTGISELSNNPEINSINSLRSVSASIDSINTTYLGTQSLAVQNDTRGFKDFLKRLWKGIKDVAIADAEGAAEGYKNGGITGAVTGAIGSSICKIVDEIKGDKKDVNTAENAPVQSKRRAPAANYAKEDSLFNNAVRDEVGFTVLEFDNNLEYKKIDSTGYYHNKVILSLLDKHDNFEYWKNLGIKELTLEVAESVEKELNLKTGELSNNNDLINNITETIQVINNYSDEEQDAYYKRMEQESPKMFELLNVIGNYVNGVGEIESMDDCIEYSNVIIDIINNADLDEESKVLLRTSINVAFSSYRLWNPEVFNKEQ